MEHRIHFDKQRKTSEVIDDSYTFIKQHFVELMLVLLASAAPFLMVFQAFTQKITPEMAEKSSLLAASSLIMLFCGQALLYTVTYGFLIAKINGKDFTREQLWPFVRTYFILILSTLSSSFLFLVIGLLALIIPGLFIAVPLGMIYIHRILTGDTFLGCLKSLIELTRGHWWQSFSVLIISAAVITGAGMVLLVPHFLWGYSPETPTIEGSVISSLSYTAYYMFSALASIPMTMQYFNLKAIKGC